MQGDRVGENLRRIKALADEISSALYADLEGPAQESRSGAASARQPTPCTGFYCGDYTCTLPFNCSHYRCSSQFRIAATEAAGG